MRKEDLGLERLVRRAGHGVALPVGFRIWKNTEFREGSFDHLLYVM